MAVAKSRAIANHAAPAHSRKAAKKSGEEIESDEVPGIRESQTVIDVLAAEDVGIFPDKNVTEALQRVSGVSISREFGEGECVSFRDADRVLWPPPRSRRIAGCLSAYIRQDSVSPM